MYRLPRRQEQPLKQNAQRRLTFESQLGGMPAGRQHNGFHTFWRSIWTSYMTNMWIISWLKNYNWFTHFLQFDSQLKVWLAVTPPLLYGNRYNQISNRIYEPLEWTIRIWTMCNTTMTCQHDSAIQPEETAIREHEISECRLKAQRQAAYSYI